MSPKWATMEQEEFLEKRYGEYRALMFKKKRSAFKDFWVNLRTEWKEAFGGAAAGDEDESKVRTLDKVSDLFEEWDSKDTNNANAENPAVVQQPEQAEQEFVFKSYQDERHTEGIGEAVPSAAVASILSVESRGELESG